MPTHPRARSRRVARGALVVSTVLLTLLGLCAGPAQARADRSPPSRPGPLTVQSVAQKAAVVRFGRSRDDVSRVTYRILANGVRVAGTRRIHDVQVPLRCGTTYFVTAVAVDAAGNRSQASPGANLRTRACLDTTAPRTPGGLRTTKVRADRVRLVWETAKDPGHGAVPNYLVYRDGTVLGGSTGLDFTATHLRPRTRYRFTVRARDRAGNLSAPARLAVTTKAPPQATGDVRAYLLASDGNSFADAQRHYRDLDRVYPTFFSVTGSGDVTGSGQPYLTTWLQERGVDVLPRFNTEDPAAIEALVTSPERRSRAAAAIARVVAASGYDGANLDFEMNMPTTGADGLTLNQRWDRLRDGYSDFVEEVAAALHPGGAELSVAVSPNWCSSVDATTRETLYCADSGSSSTRRPRAYLFDYERIVAAADEMWVMAWGLHWSTSDPGPMADVRWLRAVRSFYTDLFDSDPVRLGRVTLGTNLYGMDWSFSVVRTDQVQMPGGTIPAAPSCPTTTRTARARYSFAGGDSGTLTVEWVCLTRAATTAEYADVVAQRADFTLERFERASAENVLSGVDPADPSAQREIWFSDAASVEARADLAHAAGWHLGLWRLGDEDPALWNIASLTGSP